MGPNIATHAIVCLCGKQFEFIYNSLVFSLMNAKETFLENTKTLNYVEKLALLNQIREEILTTLRESKGQCLSCDTCDGFKEIVCDCCGKSDMPEFCLTSGSKVFCWACSSLATELKQQSYTVYREGIKCQCPSTLVVKVEVNDDH